MGGLKFGFLRVSDHFAVSFRPRKGQKEWQGEHDWRGQSSGQQEWFPEERNDWKRHDWKLGFFLKKTCFDMFFGFDYDRPFSDV